MSRPHATAARTSVGDRVDIPWGRARSSAHRQASVWAFWPMCRLQTRSSRVTPDMSATSGSGAEGAIHRLGADAPRLPGAVRRLARVVGHRQDREGCQVLDVARVGACVGGRRSCRGWSAPSYCPWRSRPHRDAAAACPAGVRELLAGRGDHRPGKWVLAMQAKVSRRRVGRPGTCSPYSFVYSLRYDAIARGAVRFRSPPVPCP